MDKGKKGAVLTLTLLVMFVGTIILGGLFMYLDTSLSLTIKSEENAVSYYAADSGIEDAILWLQHEPWGTPEAPLAGWEPCDPRNPPDQPCLNSYTIGNRTVDVSVVNPQSEGFGNNTFQINSTATAYSGARTEITSYIQMASLDFYRYGEDAITSNCSATIRGQKSSVEGNVTYVCWLDCGGDPPATDSCPGDGEDCCGETVNGTVTQDNTPPPGIDWWPETWAITEYFSDLAEEEDVVHIDGDFEIDLVDPSNASIGPLYVEGDLLITSSSKEIEHTTLNGIVYVNGDLTIKGAKDFTLDLNDQVIFVEGNGDNAYDIDIDQQCIFDGSGAIITIGDIWFLPQLSTNSDDFVFLMSLEGLVHIQPLGDFYGSIAGQDVELWPNLYIERTDSEDFWNTLPDTDVSIIKILTYDIIDQ